MKSLIGKEGIAITILRPVGRVQVNSELYQATADIGYINKDDKIKVIGYNNSQLIVTKMFLKLKSIIQMYGKRLFFTISIFTSYILFSTSYLYDCISES